LSKMKMLGAPGGNNGINDVCFGCSTHIPRCGRAGIDLAGATALFGTATNFAGVSPRGVQSKEMVPGWWWTWSKRPVKCQASRTNKVRGPFPQLRSSPQPVVHGPCSRKVGYCSTVCSPCFHLRVPRSSLRFP
jgi:hypothetical protein